MKQKEKVIVFGGSGFLGSHFINQQSKNFEVISPSHSEINILNTTEVSNFLEDSTAKIVINFTALADVELAEKEKGDTQGKAYLLNAYSVGELAKICKKLGKHLILLSTDCVFDGKKKDRPYNEDDQANPINWYGETKAIGESFLINSGSSFTIARIEMAYSSNLDFNSKRDFVRTFLKYMINNKPFQAITDQKITPTFMDDVSTALGILINNKPQGIFHIGATDWASPYEIAKTLAEEFNLDKKLIKKITFKSYSKRKTPRPQYPWLNVNKFQKNFGYNILHTNKESLALFKKKVQNKET